MDHKEYEAVRRAERHTYIVIMRASSTDMTAMIQLGLLQNVRTPDVVDFTYEMIPEFDQIVFMVTTIRDERATLNRLLNAGKTVWHNWIS